MNVFDTSAIQQARKYWLERTPYTDTIPTLAAGQAISLFSLQGWNPSDSSEMVISLVSLGITQYAGLQLSVTSDGTSERYFADSFLPGLGQVKMGQIARRNLSVILTNTTTTTMTNIQIAYVCQSWRAPVAYKILQGWALTASERNIAHGAGLPLDSAHDPGLYPIPIDFVEERSYDNRRIHASLELSRSFPIAAAGVAQVIDSIQARGNELLVLTGIGVDADFDDGVVVSVDRDNDATHVQLSAEQLSIRDPLQMFVPALKGFTFKLTATTIPPGNVPVRLDVLRASLSLVLDLRMGLVTTQQIASVLTTTFQSRGMGSSAAQKKAADTAASLSVDVAAGVR